MFQIILLFPLLFPVFFSQELREQDALCGPGDSCYALFFQRRGFLESWRACRERGGNLATVKHSQEAALVEQLFTTAAGSRGNGETLQLRLWIGLQRQPRQCAPQKPLRGFTWTTGDQDTSYTNWFHQPAPAGPPGSCSAPRCVAIGLGYGKPEDDFKWLEGSCTLPVDGFVCKFRYQGMCPALEEGSVSYSAPFGYQGAWLDRLPFGSVATVACEGQQQDVSVLCMLKEDGTVGWSKDEPLCQTPEARQCRGCQQLCRGGSCACQEGYRLQPDGRSCELEDETSFEEEDPGRGCPCQYECVNHGGAGKGYQCICPEGYQLAADGHSCEDVDECDEEEEGPCEHSCQNAPGSYVCSCDLGFTLSEEEHGRCTDVDECRIARVCQQMCVNYVGGFECFCSEGYELDGDRVSCRPAGRIEAGYESSPPMATSEEGSEEGGGEWYPGEDDGKGGYEPEWELAGTTTGRRREGWESSDPVGEEWGWGDQVEVWEDGTTAEAEIGIVPTTAPLGIGWKEEEATIDPTMDESAERTHSPLGWVEDKTLESPTYAVPALKTTLLVELEDRTTVLQTTSTGSSLMLTTMAPTVSMTKILSGKTKVVMGSVVKKGSGAPSTVTAGTPKASWEMPKVSTLASNKRELDITAPTTVVLKHEVDKGLTTVPSPRPPLSEAKPELGSPRLPSPSPHPAQESRGKRDNRWLVVALLVPLCIFLVVMLALGIVYCTRCGGDATPRSVTDCYHWVTGGVAGKGLAPSGVEAPSCRAGV
ncbi:endosialin [Ascaphus truei]|uniref:endosialin n=1 Tax=Ascaphus truei TaxID=8439 RepID=UPI003F5A634E